MKNTALLFTIAAAALLLVASPSAKAVNPLLGLVTPGDTFSFDVIAFNNTAGVASYAVAPIKTTFGTTTTYPGVGLGGSNVTITSSESFNLGAATTTDTFTVSTPSNFAPTGYQIGTSNILGLEFDLGNDTTFADPVNLATPTASTTTTGSSIYSTSTAFALAPVVTLLNSGTAYSAYEGVSVGSGSINTYAFHSFTINVTYPTLALVPEPSTWAMMGVGMVGCAGVVFRRRKVS